MGGFVLENPDDDLHTHFDVIGIDKTVLKTDSGVVDVSRRPRSLG